MVLQLFGSGSRPDHLISGCSSLSSIATCPCKGAHIHPWYNLWEKLFCRNNSMFLGELGCVELLRLVISPVPTLFSPPAPVVLQKACDLDDDKEVRLKIEVRGQCISYHTTFVITIIPFATCSNKAVYLNKCKNLFLSSSQTLLQVVVEATVSAVTRLGMFIGEKVL